MQNPAPPEQRHDLPGFLAGGGQAGVRIAGHDWAATALGPIESWPQSLRTALGIVLHSAVPIVLLWGEDGVMLYNDAYSVLAGSRHPQLLGAKLREGWPEVAAFSDHVMRTVLAGDTLAYRDQELLLHRHGVPAPAWMNLDYSPVHDEAGRPAGVIAIVVETTERVLAERRAEAERERLARLFEQAPGFIAITRGPEHVYEFVNDAHQRLFGQRDLLGRTVREGFPEVTGQGIHEMMDRVHASGERFAASNSRVLVRPAPGAEPEERFLDFVLAPIVDEDGTVTGLFCKGHDVTDRTRAVAALNETTARLADIANAAPVMIWIADEAQRCIWYNQPHLAFTGQTLAQAIDEGWRTGVHPDDRERCGAVYDAAFAARQPFRIEYRLRRHDGAWRVVDDRGVPRLAADGGFRGFLGSCMDVTEQREAEQALARSEEQLRLATEAAEIGLWDLNIGQDRLFWPARVKAMFGIAPDRPISMADYYAGLHPDDAAATSAAFAAAIDPARRALYDVEYRTVGREDGVVRWVAAKGRALFDDDGRCVRVIGTAIDISARKAAEVLLRELNETLERRVAAALAERKILADIVEGTDAMVQVLDRDFRWLAVNRAAASAFERIHGVRPRVGGRLLDLLDREPAHRAQVQARWARALDGESFTAVAPVGTPVGAAGPERRQFEMAFNPLRDRAGTIIGAYQFAHDVTARLADQERLAEAEANLRQAQKIEALGQLTGGVAHDFNNLLTVIAGGLEMVDRNPEPVRRQRIMAGMKQAVMRGAALTRQLLAFARRQALTPEPVDLAQQIGAMRDLLDRSLRGDVQVRTDFPPGLWPVEVDPGELELVILNLCVNARDAMPGGGTITISARNFSAAADGIDSAVAGDTVLLEVADTGVGMSAAVLARVFEPFFTTKEIGQGSGLGLAQVYGFARQSGGEAAVDSAPGQGTRVRLTLPRTEKTPPPPRRPSIDLAAGQATRTDAGCVLLVEDDEEVAHLVTEMLGQLGYQVTRAATGAAALGALANGRPLDVVFSDIMMPGGMTGLDLARELRRRRPDLPVVLTSGYSEAARREAEAAGLRVLPKPFTLQALAVALEAARPP